MHRKTIFALGLFSTLMMPFSAKAQDARWATDDDPGAIEIKAKDFETASFLFGL